MTPGTGNPETWLADRLAAGKPAETWYDLPDWPHQASDTGRVRTADGTELSQRFTGGYWRIDLYKPAADGKPAVSKKGVPVHWCVLTACDRPRPKGMQASHLTGNPDWNWWPEGLAWEDQPANERRKTSRPPAPDPAFPCVNAPKCDGKARHEGRRCLDCVAVVRTEAAAMLNAGKPLSDVAARFGNTERWIYRLAVEGGYKGEIEQARTQRPPLTGWRARVAKWLRAA